MSLTIWILSFLYILAYDMPIISEDFVNIMMDSCLIFTFLCFEALNFLDQDSDSKFFRYKFSGIYSDIFKDTITKNFKKITNIRAAIFVIFLVINILLAVFCDKYINSIIIIGFYFGLLSINSDLTFCFASKKEREKYNNYLKKDYLSFSKAGIFIISMIIVVSLFFLYFLSRI